VRRPSTNKRTLLLFLLLPPLQASRTGGLVNGVTGRSRDAQSAGPWIARGRFSFPTEDPTGISERATGGPLVKLSSLRCDAMLQPFQLGVVLLRPVVCWPWTRHLLIRRSRSLAGHLFFFSAPPVLGYGASLGFKGDHRTESSLYLFLSRLSSRLCTCTDIPCYNSRLSTRSCSGAAVVIMRARPAYTGHALV
jgi:hypothetical protein